MNIYIMHIYLSIYLSIYIHIYIYIYIFQYIKKNSIYTLQENIFAQVCLLYYAIYILNKCKFQYTSNTDKVKEKGFI